MSEEIIESSGNVFADLDLPYPEVRKALADILIGAGVTDQAIFNAVVKVFEARIAELEARLASFADLEKRERKALEFASDLEAKLKHANNSLERGEKLIQDWMSLCEQQRVVYSKEIANLKDLLKEARECVYDYSRSIDSPNNKFNILLLRIDSALSAHQSEENIPSLPNDLAEISYDELSKRIDRLDILKGLL